MDKKPEIEYYKRGFLNTTTHGMAAFEAKVDNDGRYVSAGFSITDCSRKVSLDFDCWDKQDTQNSRDKLRTLIYELQAFQVQFENAVKLMEEMEERKATEKKAAEAKTQQKEKENVSV